MENVNWEQIKTEYITTDTSQRKLAEKHGVPLSNIERRSRGEGWVRLRRDYKGKVTAKTLDYYARGDAKRLSKLIDTTTKAIEVVVNAFADDDQFNRYLVERRESCAVPMIEDNGEGDETAVAAAYKERQWTEEKIFKKTDTKALKDLTSVLKDLTGLMCDFYNIPTPSQAEAQRIAAERLELDRAKAESGKEETDYITVVFDAGPEAWNE